MAQLFERFVKDGEARNLSGTTPHGYRQIWKRCASIQSLPVARLRPAHLRHSTGSSLIRSGIDVRTVAAVLRHSSAATTLNV